MRPRAIRIASDLGLRWFVLLAVLGATAISLAQPVPDNPYEITAVLQLGPQHPADHWVPVRVQLMNRSDHAVDGMVSMPVAGGRQAYAVGRVCHVPARSRIVVELYGCFARAGAAPAGNVLSRVEWLSDQGQRLAMTDLVGATQGAASGPASSTADTTTDSGNGAALLLVISDHSAGETEDSITGTISDVAALEQMLAGVLEIATAAAWVRAEDAPGQRAGYDACRGVILDLTDPDALDMAQRQALIDHMLSGGSVIVPAARASSAFDASWLGAYPLVRIVGRHASQEVSGTFPDGSAAAIRLRRTAEIVDAVSDDAEVVFRDPHRVHAAFTRIGLGRLVFMSFPINALDPQEQSSRQLITFLMGLGEPSPSWDASQLGKGKAQYLESMIGTPTAPWLLAASITGAYLVVAVLILLPLSVDRRPWGFAILVGIAICGAATLAGLTQLRDRSEQLVGARLATVDLACSGGGVVQEETTWLGREIPSLAVRTQGLGAMLWPTAVDSTRPPVVLVDPFIAPQAGARSRTIERIWGATSPVGPTTRLRAVGTFGPDGLSLALDNAVGQTVRAPLLRWNSTAAVFQMQDVAPGEVLGVQPRIRNPPDDYSSAQIIASESSKLRASIARAASTPVVPALADAAQAAQVLGWLEDLAPVLSLSHPVRMRTQALLRAPLLVNPSPVGSHVAIDGAFVRLQPGPIAGIPFDAARQRWIATGQPGQWVVGFVPPPQIGRLRPTRVELRCDASAPDQAVSLLAEQFRADTLVPNPAGRVVARWERLIEPQIIAFAPGDGDVDQNGYVWLMLRVEKISETAQGLAQWTLRGLELSYEAEVIGPASELRETRGAQPPPAGRKP